MEFSNIQLADTLDAAADLYESERYDWCRGMALSSDGLSICASQALAMACGLEVEEQPCTLEGCRAHKAFVNRMARFNEPLYKAAESTLAPRLGGLSIPMWNDQVLGTAPILAPGTPVRGAITRTKQDVIELFKTTGKELRNDA